MLKKDKVELRYIDLFSGVGGFRYALNKTASQFKIKTKCVGFSETDQNAIKTYKANHILDNEAELGDISNLTSFDTENSKTKASDGLINEYINEKVSDFDILFAGFPCQPFSLMGNGRGFADTRGTLFFHIEKLIMAKRPKFFLLENVRGLYNHNKRETFNQIMAILSNKLGYEAVAWILNSADYGVPQTRRRLYILGFDRSVQQVVADPPKPQNIMKIHNPTAWHILDKKVDDKYYLSDKILKTILSHGSGGFRSKSEINKLIARPLCATMHKMHRACQDNYYSDSFIKGYFDEENQLVKKRRLKNDRIRRLSPTEAFRLQGFDDGFVNKARDSGVSDTQLYRQAGNSITITTVSAILRHVFQKSDLLQATAN